MRVRACGLAATVLLWGCTSVSDAVQWAQQIDFATSYAHMVLRTRFAESPQEEDSVDEQLLAEVAALDAADEALPAKVQRLERGAMTPPGERAVERDAILRDLEAITERCARVTGLLRPRPVHEVVRQALSPIPAAVQRLRQRLTAHVADVTGR